MKQVEIEHLSKCYKKKVVFNDVSLIIDNLSYNFLIGNNGTGKSTFIKCLINQVKYIGIIKSNFLYSYCPESFTYPDYMSVIDFLKMMSFRKDVDFGYYLQLFSIENYKKTDLCHLSKGTKQKVLLILTFIIEADIYIFDEPLSGLDEDSKLVFIDEIRRLKKQKKIIIITTHRIDDYNIRKKRTISFPLGDNNEINEIA